MVSVKFLFAINKDLFTHLAMNKNIKGVRNKQFFFLYLFHECTSTFIYHTHSVAAKRKRWCIFLLAMYFTKCITQTFRIYQTIWNILQPIAAVMIFQIYYMEWHKIFSTYSYNFNIYRVVSHILSSRTMGQFFFFLLLLKIAFYMLSDIFLPCVQ